MCELRAKYIAVSIAKSLTLAGHRCKPEKLDREPFGILDTYPNLKAEDVHLVEFHTFRLRYTLHARRYKWTEI